MIFDLPQGTTLPAITDGTSNTIMVLEAHPKSAVIWTKPDDLVIDEKDPLKASSASPTTASVPPSATAACGLSAYSVDPKVFWWMLLMNDGNPLPQ